MPPQKGPEGETRPQRTVRILEMRLGMVTEAMTLIGEMGADVAAHPQAHKLIEAFGAKVADLSKDTLTKLSTGYRPTSRRAVSLLGDEPADKQVVMPGIDDVQPAPTQAQAPAQEPTQTPSQPSPPAQMEHRKRR